MSEIGDLIRAEAPLSTFPDGILSMEKLSAPTATQLQLILQYNEAVAEGDWTTCQNILNTNPDLERCRINTTDFNKIIDEIKAIELYYQEEMDDYFDALDAEIARRAAEASKINDSSISLTTTYSSEKIEDMFDKITEITHVELPLADWESTGGSAPYTQTVEVTGMTADSYPLWYYDGTPDADQYETFCYISSMETASGEVTFTCASDAPIATVYIMIKGL